MTSRPSGTTGHGADSPGHAELLRRVRSLPLPARIDLLTGAALCDLRAEPRVGLRTVRLSDGPAGVRGIHGGQGLSSASFPSPTAAAATWDRGALRRLGALFAAEARRQDVHGVLAPTANLHRSPYEGRHFEYLSEDPALTSAVVAELVTAIQRHGVAACVKHFVANESETERTTYVSRVDERTLHEVYFAPFEAAVEAGVWLVMATYNGLDDGHEHAPACEHRRLLTDTLKRRWGFDGVVVSDWMAAQSCAPTALAGLDLVMPGPEGPWSGGALLAAVESGEVPEALVDDKAARVLRLAHRVGALDEAAPRSAPEVDVRSELRELAARSMVVLRAEGRAFPLDRARLRRVALLGPNAVDAFTQGGGSGRTYPERVVSPAEGLRAALGDGVELVVEQGCDARGLLPPLAGEALRRATVEWLDDAGAVVAEQPLERPWTSVSRREPGQTRARVTAEVELVGDGTHLLEAGVLGAHRTWVDGGLIHHEPRHATADDVLASVNNNPLGGRTEVGVVGRRVVEVRVELEIPDLGGFGHWGVVVLRHQPPRPSLERRIAAAAEAAAGADVAVVVVGTNDEVESEGFDRTSLALPGAQDRLVRAVAATGTPTVVVVNAGAPVLLPWLDEPDDARNGNGSGTGNGTGAVDAVLWAWFPGQECGAALADVLLGVTEPAGRLPWTLPAAERDVPKRPLTPVDGVLNYAEGVFVGHRAWDAAGVEPARPFGFGLGWTSWAFDKLTAPERATPGEPVTVTVAVRNTGQRRGRCLAQAYLEPPAGAQPERPARWLAAFEGTELDPGEAGEITLTVPARAFAVWDVAAGDWATPPGRYGLVVGAHSRDAALRAVVGIG
ncbi:beta-glucosidase [Streptomyces sp. 3MP-14]|uniref:Beta-glucosidase n=1 Tax=Streptomyces mimosae TaxID=2586635 RepID=A0A5N5ZQP8_9ACTN|nr:MULTISPECIES: glycoside hydrolase family 3 C-terminal domain-containing protein [Streptomyces]KAB8158831.1 beta-glucosidase [Streptomyces mimosae]KAB8172733.1 beta-glucosidase [Streptomyces sp. 3MP-14]